jgi:hypothetical protein
VSEAIDGLGRSRRREEGLLGGRGRLRLFLRRCDCGKRREAFGGLETSELNVSGSDPAENVEVRLEGGLSNVDLLELCDLNLFVQIPLVAIIPFLFEIRVVVLVRF